MIFSIIIIYLTSSYLHSAHAGCTNFDDSSVFGCCVCVLCSWVRSDSIVLHINLIIYLRTKYNISKQNVSCHIWVHVSIETEAFINNNPLEWWKYAVRLAFGRCSNFIERKRERDRKEHWTKIWNRHHFVVEAQLMAFFHSISVHSSRSKFTVIWASVENSHTHEKKDENSNNITS